MWNKQLTVLDTKIHETLISPFSCRVSIYIHNGADILKDNIKILFLLKLTK